MVLVEQQLHRERGITLLHEAISGKPDAIYLMSGGVAHGRNVPYRSTSLLDPDSVDGRKFGYLGGSLRVHAVAELYRQFPQATIITSSTVAGISHAEVQERELRAIWKKWGITQPEEIVREERSNSSRTELAELLRLIIDHNIKGKILVVTNDYHVPRVKKTLEHLPQLMEKQDKSFSEVWKKFQEREDVSIEIHAAETILQFTSLKFDVMLGTVFKKEPWKSYRQIRLDVEQQGVDAIENNTYDSEQVRKK